MSEFPLHQLANIDVQYEDNHVIVAVKPPNMLSQADKTGDTDILTQLKEYIKIKYNKPGAVYLGLVAPAGSPGWRADGLCAHEQGGVPAVCADA